MRFTRTTLAYVTLVVAFVELVIITYNQLTGYIVVAGPWQFIVRWIIGTTAAMILAVPMVYADLRILATLDRSLRWEIRFWQRIIVEMLLATVVSVICGCLLTTGAHLAVPYKDGLVKNLVNNSLITAVVNVIVVAGLEAIIALRRTRASQARARRLEEENAQVRFEVLKNQLNPHFLFNSLNVLSSLIGKDAARAQEFVDVFSSVYRYTLDVIDKPVIELERELAFAKSYLYLQKIRFEGCVLEEICVGADLLNHLIPPLALQTVLENAFKHNAISEETPLRLSVTTEEGRVVVTNSLRVRQHASGRQGVGLENLKKRYAFVCDEPPQFVMTGDTYIAKLPLIPAQ